MENKNKYKYARAFIVLLAALITMILNIKYNRDLLQSLLILLAVIVIFYVVSSTAMYLINKIANMHADTIKKVEASEEEEAENAEDDTEGNTTEDN